MRRAASIVILAALLTGCGSSGAATPTATPGGGGGANASPPASSAAASQGGGGGNPAGALPDACTLLTAADAQTALGQPVGEATANQGGGSSDNCTYAPTVLTGFVSIELSVFGSATFARVKQATAGVTMTPVGGLGDDALFIDAGALGTQLDVLKGGTAFYVVIFDTNDSADQIKAAEQTVAQTVLGRL